MNPETKQCQMCRNDFTIGSEDFDFYEKVSVPAPTLCPDCRQQRRYAWRNERTLYRRNCDLCQKSTVSIYSPNKPFKVFCVPCWWGDGWDPADYGRDFDFARPVFEQFGELMRETPRMALLNKNSINSEYSHHAGDNKNAYLTFSAFDNENIFYSTFIMKSRDCVDCSYLYDAVERCYEVLDSRKSYQCQWSMLLKDCANLAYCYDCHGSSDCFMSSNLRNKRFVFRNEQLTREDYMARVAEYDLGSFAHREQLVEEFRNLVRDYTIHKFAVSERNANSTGSMIFNSKNARDCFDGDKFEDTKYYYSGIDARMCMDLYHAGHNMELCYELHGCTRVTNSMFCHMCYDNAFLQYCDSCQNSQNLFGCVSIKKGEYMILNKKYSKEEYTVLREQIVEHMKSTGEYGEFFPPAMAPIYYNETQGNFYMPLSHEEVLARGWNWEDQLPGTFGRETITTEDIADNIRDAGAAATKEIYACMDCTKNYNIIPDEFAFYKRETIPLPRRCPDCRYKRRFAMRPPRKLWHRDCMCESSGHEHTGRCQNEFETPFAPERPETVYCESCYQKEVI
jgi:DNA-directed RNA polymerase subunit RPC12/RpoP